MKPPFLVLEKKSETEEIKDFRIKDSEIFINPEPKVMTKSKDCPTMVDAKLDYLAYPAGKYLILPFSQKCN